MDATHLDNLLILRLTEAELASWCAMRRAQGLETSLAGACGALCFYHAGRMTVTVYGTAPHADPVEVDALANCALMIAAGECEA